MSEQAAPSVDALVVGAGPVGLMMAGELARHGVSCRIVDQGEGPSTTSKAIGVHSRTLEVPEDEFHAFLSPEGALVVFPLPDPGRARIIYDCPDAAAPVKAAEPDAQRAPVPAPSLEDVQATLAARTGLRATASDPRWLTGFRIHRRIASAYRKGRVFLAGDAAHIHSPVGGQGMNTGIQDAYNLAWKVGLVTRGAARPPLLDSYEAERRPVAAATVKGTDLATQLVTLRHPVARWARNRLTEVLSGVEVVQQRGLRAASQIAIGYRKSPIVAEHRAGVIARLTATGPVQPSLGEWRDFGAAPHPGDRAADARYPGAHGERRLFELLRGPRHALLLFDGAAATPEGYKNLAAIALRVRLRLGEHVTPHIVVPRAVAPPELRWDGSLVLDADGAIHQRYGAASECLYLIRPDGYVGYRSQPADGVTLDAFLSSIFTGV